MRVVSLPKDERPRERLRRCGAESLSGAELLAILLRTGTRSKDVLELATEVLAAFGGITGLARAVENELMAFQGLGETKAAVLITAVEQIGRASCRERV